MKFTSRAAVSGAFLVAPLMLMAGCGGSTDAKSSSQLTPVQPTSYVELPPATTTTTTTLAPGVTIPGGGISPTEQQHTIVSGDNLSKISNLYDVPIDAICNYNQWADCIDPPHLLLPGAIVLIPPNALVPGATATEVDVPVVADSGDGDTAATGEGCQHTIVSGDNPTRVAKKYNITVDELSNANLNNPVWNTFLLGAQLTIPANGTC